MSSGTGHSRFRKRARSTTTQKITAFIKSIARIHALGPARWFILGRRMTALFQHELASTRGIGVNGNHRKSRFTWVDWAVSMTRQPMWGRLIDLAEAVLIYKASPPYNSSRINSLNCASRVLVINHGMRGRLPESVSNITEFVNRVTGLITFQAKTNRAPVTPQPYLIQGASRIDAD